MNATATAAKDENVAPMKPDTVTVKLSRVLTTHKGDINALELKEPSADPVLRHGLPWKSIVFNDPDTEIGSKFEIEFIPGKMAYYIEAMSGLDRETLKEVSARDMSQLFTAVLGMLQPAGN